MQLQPSENATQLTREAFPFFVQVATRVTDLDPNNHVNQSRYHAFFDTALAVFFRSIDLAFPTGDTLTFCAENRCLFFREVGFPAALEVGIRILHIGNSSAHFEFGLFEDGHAALAAQGVFANVFVSRTDRKPRLIPPDLRSKLHPFLKNEDA